LYRLDESTTVYAPKYPLESPVHAHTHSPPSCAKIIGLPSYETPDIYTVVFPDGSVSEYTEDMLSLIPSSNPIPSTSHLPNWIKSGVKATLFLSNMAQPKHGTLHYTPNDCTWTFFPGKQVVTNGILLPDLMANCRELLDTGQLFRGHTKFKNVYNARNQVVLQDCVLRHILAYGFKSLIPPTSPKQHTKLDPNDKAVWDSTYDEEYDGLSSLPTWEVVSEGTYRKMSKGAKALPTMALATIKYDSENRPKRAKYRIVYRIVVLGNLDYHNWTKASTATPVLSQVELRLLTALTVHHKCILKNCDMKQALVQAILPEDEVYFLKPPPGCPRSKPGEYWRLLRSLYGVKRASHLWFEKMKAFLLSIGFRSCANHPCVFVGNLIDGEPPIYAGLYVVDILYFSPSDTVEQHFENLLSEFVQVEFMGQVSHFLGIEFNWQFHDDGNLSVTLTQQSFAENLVDSLHLGHISQSTYSSPYRSNLPVDAIPHVEMSSSERDALRLKFQSIIGSLNWLAHTTRPDLSMIVSILAQHQTNPSPGHLDAALYVVKYLAGIKNLGIYFTSSKHSIIESFFTFSYQPTYVVYVGRELGPTGCFTQHVKTNFTLICFEINISVLH